MSFSVDAQRICARWFPWGEKCSVRSHPPHATLKQYGGGMEELVAAGVVKAAPFNKHGSMEYIGTAEAVEIGKAERLAMAREAGLIP